MSKNRAVFKRYIFYSTGRQYYLNSPRHPVNRYRRQLLKDGVDFTERTGLADSFPGVTDIKARTWNFRTGKSDYTPLFTEKETVVVFEF